MKKTNPLLLWVLLWVFGLFFITLRNHIAAQVGIEWGRILFQNLLINIINIPVSLIVYFVIKFVTKLVGIQDFFDGQNGLRNVLLTWLVLFVLAFLFPLFVNK